MYQVIFFHYAHHALSILNHSGKHGCQSVTIFQLTKRAGVAFQGFFPNIRCKLEFFIQNQLGNWQKTAKI